MKELLNLVVRTSGLMHFGTITLACILNHILHLSLSSKANQNMASIISGCALISIILIIILQIVTDLQVEIPKWDDVVVFDRARNLEAMVLTLGAFRFNKEILEMISGNKRLKREMAETYKRRGEGNSFRLRGYSGTSMMLFFFVGLSFGYLFFLSNLTEFRQGLYALGNYMDIYQNSFWLMKLVSVNINFGVN